MHRRLCECPFATNVPEGAKAYTLADDFTLQEVATIAAHQPVLVEAIGLVTFTGSGEIAYATSPSDAALRGTYVQLPLYVGDYVLGQQEGQWGLVRQTKASTLAPFDVYAQVDSQAAFIPLGLTASSIEDVDVTVPSMVAKYYDLQGRQLVDLTNVQKGQTVIARFANGTVRKMVKRE